MHAILLLLIHFLVCDCQKCTVITERRCDEAMETNSDVAHSLTAQGPPGKRGPVGQQGPIGPTGPTGPRGPSVDVSRIMRELNQTLERILGKWREELFPKSCSYYRNGVMTLFSGEEVFCHNGWRVFQRRFDGSVAFHRKTWDDFENGFGRLTGEFWIGLETIHKITNNSQCRLRIDLIDDENDSTFAEYSQFSVESKFDGYRMHLGQYSGTAGDAMTVSRSVYNLDGMLFSTVDVDNDRHTTENCAQTRGAFWHNQCGYGRLNARWLPTSTSSNTISWYHWKNRWGRIKAVTMKVQCN